MKYMRVSFILIFLLSSAGGLAQDEKTVISVEKEKVISHDLVGVWSLMDEKEKYDHIIRFKGDNSFSATTGLSTSGQNLKGTWTAHSDTLIFHLTEPEVKIISYEIRKKNKNEIMLLPVYDSLLSYELRNILYMKKQNLH